MAPGAFSRTTFFSNVEEAVWQPLAHPDDEGKIPVGHNHGLVHAGGELIVVDTGYGDDTR
ncbi:MAG TPA: hypothetical protein VFP68_13475 [Burkholderiaceae bacterium]|nr:hypothetical protein [Burkholderiaceae bacterium]